MRPVSDLSDEQAKIVRSFMRAHDACFYKLMGKTSVTRCGQARLEFPAQFLKDHAEKFGSKVTLQRPGCGTRWKLRIHAIASFWKINQQIQRRAFVLGKSGGWKDFVVHNDIQLGDLLLFILVEGNQLGGYSNFRVHIFRNFVDAAKIHVAELLD